ncbi:RNA-guided endonuclease TnpB family protein, partial [Fusobacterium hwasookii]
ASFIIDGRKLKSINQYYNKINAKLQSIKDKQKIEHITLRQKRIARKRNNRIEDYLSKAARIIINYCLNNDIGKLVLGYNEDFQRNSNIGSINNQNFVNIPYGKLRDKLIYLCKLYGIEFKLQEESYTSKASFFDGDEIPIYDKENQKEYIFSGKRIKRGLYQTSAGKLINADCNGALNILRKSKVVDLSVLYNRGELNTPKRIRVV